jgi:hypothetical protein
MTKIAGSGSISQRHASAYPDQDHTKMSWIRNTVLNLLVLCRRVQRPEGVHHLLRWEQGGPGLQGGAVDPGRQTQVRLKNCVTG